MLKRGASGFLSIFIFFILFSWLLILTPTVRADTIFIDDFEDGTIFDKWVHFSGNWVVQNFDNSLWVAVNSGSYSDNEIQAKNFSGSDYEFLLDIFRVSGEDINLFFRIQPNRYYNLPGHNLPVGYGLHLKNGRFALQKFTPTSGTELGAPFNEPFPPDSRKKIKVRLKGNNIKVFVDNRTEPIIDYTDNDNPYLSGGIALAAITGASGSYVRFDNVVVSELQELPSLAVPDIKQTSAPWHDDIYDHAQNWSSVPTIYRWGCALSSAVMVLRYFGHDVWPDQLNEWLKGQVDGYLRNGLINWLAVSRYTRIHDSPTSPTLEYRRLPASFDVLLNELKDGRPGILKEPGHFVVAKSKTPTSFGINDPFYLDRTTLESYGNSFLSLGSYLPSHTDLSYIQLVVDPQFNIQVFDSENNLLDGYTFLEEPIVDPETSQENTDFLRIFQFPKPEDGNYLIKVIGDGIYSLEAYVYSENGDVYYKKIEGVARGEDLVNLSYNDSQPEIEDFVSFESILDDVDSLCSLGKIRNKGTCIALKTQILNAKRFFDIGMRDKSVKMLEIPQQLLKNLSKVKPSLIDDEASLILLREMESLINLFS